MAIKKYANGSWVPASFRKYGTETDTITTLPATVIGDGTPISSYIIKGNMEQSGTPTPSSPIYPSECGERTENLFEVKNDMLEASSWGDNPSTRYFINYKLSELQVQILKQRPCTCSVFENFSEGYIPELLVCAICPTPTTAVGADYRILDNGVKHTKTFDFSSWDDVYLVIGYGGGFSDITSKQLKINELFTNWLISIVPGSTAPESYIPYGYKLPLTLGSTTTNIYLGEVQSTRRIKKLVLDGTEDWIPESTDNFYTSNIIDNALAKKIVVCSHQASVSSSYVAGLENVWISASGRLNFTTTAVSHTATDFKSYLAAQHAAGTPVTVWYILTEPETGIVNEPIRKIGDYVDSVSGTNLATSGAAQELDVGTALKPSEFDLTYHGWHEHGDTKFTT